MKCFVCGKELESGKYILNTYLCRNFCSHECEQKYMEKRIGKAEPTTAEMLLWLVGNVKAVCIFECDFGHLGIRLDLPRNKFKIFTTNDEVKNRDMLIDKAYKWAKENEMTEIEQKAVEELVDRIGKFYNYQITQPDAYELAKFLDKKGYREQSETITFYKDPNIKDWAESEYAWCERPCDSNMSMRAIDKKGNIVGYASEHYWTWCDVKEVKKVSAREYMGHFASKQSETVKEFAEKIDLYLVSLFHKANDSQKECEQHNGTVWENGWQRKDERMIMIQNDIQPFIRQLAEKYGKEDNDGYR